MFRGKPNNFKVFMFGGIEDCFEGSSRGGQEVLFIDYTSFNTPTLDLTYITGGEM